jgi:thermitase
LLQGGKTMRNFCLVLLLLIALSACNVNVNTGGGGSTNPTEPYVVENPTQEVIVEPTSDNAPLPTHTPVIDAENPETEATLPVPVTSSDGCEAVASASGIVIDAEAERAEAPRTLPNGRPFPGTEPREVGIQAQGANARTEVLIQFTPESTPNERNEFIRQIGGSKRKEIDALNTYIVTLRPNTTLTDVPQSPIVIRVEVDETAAATQEPTAPNDARFAEQWALPMVGLPEAWASLPAGRSVIVAVIDSGVCLNHPDLQGRLVQGYDFVQNDNDPSDVFGHGCGVAGVIAANANNGIGIAGVAPNAQIMPLRVLDERGLGSYSNIASAIIYAADNGANIINLSLAGSTNSVILEQAVAYAVSRGIVVIAAAGNFNSPNTFYPAAYPSVIAVGSVDVNLQRSSFSNYGSFVDVYAPGRDILATSMNGDYALNSGTSFAAPIVAGLTAMSQAFDTPLNTENGIVFLYPPENLPNCP